MTKVNKVALGILVIVASSVFVFTLVYVSKQLIASERSNDFDYYVFWYGSRAVLSGENPYTTEVTQAIQLGIFGENIPEGQFLHAYAYPPYLAFLLLLLVSFPFNTSLLIFLVIQFPLLFASIFMMSYILKLQFSPFQYAILALTSSIGFVYPAIAYATGQLSIIFLFLFVLAAFFFARGNIPVGGVILAFTSIRPDLYLVAIVIVMLGLRDFEKIRSVIISSVISLLALTLASMALIGFWIPDWVSMVIEYSQKNPYTHWPPEFIQSTFLRSLLIIGVLIWGSYYLLKSHRAPTNENLMLGASALILILFTLNKQSGPYLMTLLLIPAFLLFGYMNESRWRWLIILLLITPWFYRFHTSGINLLTEELVIPLEFILFQQVFVMIRRYKPKL